MLMFAIKQKGFKTYCSLRGCEEKTDLKIIAEHYDGRQMTADACKRHQKLVGRLLKQKAKKEFAK